jgi:hypothetical protein
VSNKNSTKSKYFSVYPEFHGGRHGATNSPQTTGKLFTPILSLSFVASPLENPQSYTHEVKDRSHTQQSPATNSSHPLPKNAAQ